MLNKLLAFIRQQDMVQPGDRIICALSGGADSVALLWGLYLLREKLQITLEAAHFNHSLRGAESDADEQFVKDLCARYDIPLHLGKGAVISGEKGLEAAARNARYAFLQSLPGKIATAHTADDNAETLLMHLVRGTGLKGLGGIASKRKNLIRPMLTVTRQEVLAFLEKENIPYVTDSSNETDAFFRNRLRHRVMPLLKAENPSLAENLSATALNLRQDAEALDAQAEPVADVTTLRGMHPAVLNRTLKKLLESFGVKEPERAQVERLRQLLYSANPSAYAQFPGGILIGRQYDRLVKLEDAPQLGEYPLSCPGETEIPELGIKVICTVPGENPQGVLVRMGEDPVLRSRRAGDCIKLSGGTKQLKKLFIDQKIPAWERPRIPVIADSTGVVLVAGIGPDQERLDRPNIVIAFENM